DKNEAVTLVVPVPAERYETFLNELSLLIAPARQRLSAVGESEGDVFLWSVTKRFQKRLLRRGPREKEKVSGTGDAASLEDEKADGGKVEEERDAELAAEQKRVEPTRSGLATGVAVQQFKRRPQKVKLVIRLNRLDKGYAAGAAEEDAEKKAHPPAMGF
ncbi:MAG: hypothetical protein KGZ25_11575, partial [Planctomycetes bacterium]|nr:hypothetical protein [Planctomycetota bacterium]